MQNVSEDSTCCQNDLKAQMSPWVRKWAHLIKSGDHVLDLAAGGGRHGRYFLEQGSKVTFVDRTTDKLTDLSSCTTATILTVDLEGRQPWPFEAETFDAILGINYLHRPLFENLFSSLKPQGIFIYETFAEGNADFGRPRRPDFLLKPEELLNLSRKTLQTIAYEHGLIDDQGSLSVKQSLCGVKKPNLQIPRRS